MMPALEMEVENCGWLHSQRRLGQGVEKFDLLCEFKFSQEGRRRACGSEGWVFHFSFSKCMQRSLERGFIANMENMRTSLLLLVACASIIGCAVPKSRDEMLASVKTFNRVCSSDLAPNEAVERLRSAWSMCFVSPRSIGVVPIGKTVIVHENSRIHISSDRIGEISVLLARIAPPPFGLVSPLSNSVLLMADIQATAECRSEVVVRATNSHWEKRSAQTSSWLLNPTVMPPEAACDR